MNRDILISGASVAGPTLAYWLRRHGFTPTVVERAPAPRGGGQAIDLRGTARGVAERMGIMDRVRAAHTGAHEMAFVDGAGRTLATMGADLLGDSGGAIADIEVLRGDLVRILHDMTRAGVEYVFDDAIASLDQRDDGVRVTFEHGAPRTFGLVLGADGLHSRVRELAFGPERRHVHDLGAYVSVFRMPVTRDMGGRELMCPIPGRNGARGRTAALYPLAGTGEAIAMFFFALPPAGYDRHDVARQKELVAEAFAGDAWEVPSMLDAMRDARDFYFDRVCQIRMDAWSSGRVALLGDAAHCGSPLAGNGTSMAMVGAYVLAGELAAASGDHERAFAAYEGGMRDFVARCQRFAEQGGGTILPTSQAGMWFRYQLLRMLPYMPWRGMIGAGIQKTANAVALKDYAAVAA